MSNQDSNIQHAFKSTLPGMNYPLKSGEIAQFIVRDDSGVALYYTNDEDIIKELTAEVNKKHPFIYIDPAEPTVDITALTPMARLEKQLRHKIMQELRSKTDPANNMGIYENVTTGARSVVTTRSAQGLDITEDEKREILLASTREQQYIAQQVSGVGQVATPDNGASAVFSDENTVVVNNGAGGQETITLPDAAAGAQQVEGSAGQGSDVKPTQPAAGAEEVSTATGNTGKLNITLNKNLGNGS